MPCRFIIGCLVGLLFLRLSSLFFFALERPEARENALMDRLVLRIRTRAAFLKMRALFSLFLVILVLIAGGTFIVRAGALIQQESVGDSKLEQVTSILTSFETDVEVLRMRLVPLDVTIAEQKLRGMSAGRLDVGGLKPQLPETASDLEVRIAAERWVLGIQSV